LKPTVVNLRPEVSKFLVVVFFDARSRMITLRTTVSSNKISFFNSIVNSKRNSKTSNKQQKIKLIEENRYWNQPLSCSLMPDPV
jgi:hypothetical protein